jgi:hypothetical protein
VTSKYGVAEVNCSFDCSLFSFPNKFIRFIMNYSTAIDHLLNGTTNESVKQAEVKTKPGSRLEATQQIYVAARRVDNVINELSSYADILANKNSSQREIQETARKIKEGLNGSLLKVSSVLTDSAKHIAPIASIKTVCDRNDKRKMKEIVDPTNKRKSADYQMLESYSKGGTTPLNKKKRAYQVTPTSSAKKAKKAKQIRLPAPINGTEYTKAEVISIIVSSEYKKSDVIRQMIRDQLIPCDQCTVYRLIQKHNAGIVILDQEWNSGGRPRVFTTKMLEQVNENHLQGEHGRSYSKDEVKTFLLQHRKKLIEESGHISLNAEDDIKRTTLSNCIAELTMMSANTLTESAIDKTDNRYAAENSIRGSINNLLLVAVTHFVDVDEEDRDVVKELKSLQPETRMLYDWVCRARSGVPCYPIHPDLTFSTDESTEFIFEGSSNKQDKFLLVSRESLKRKGTNSIYQIDNSNKMNGMRVKLTWTFSGAGICAPLFVTVTGLNDREMPSDVDMIVVKIPGLCIGGCGVSGNKEVGYVVFMKKGNGGEEAPFKYYHDKVLMPFIKQQREDFHGADGIAVRDDLTAVSWSDGDMSQIKAVASEHQLFRDEKVTVNKQNAARTGVEQPADLAKVFKVFSELGKVITVSNIHPSRHPMKRVVYKAFKEELKSLNLSDKKLRALVDFISVLPELATKAATRGNIIHGFHQSGIIDEEVHRYPVLHKILATCRSSIPKELIEKIEYHFDYLYKLVLDEGRIPEHVFDELDFPKDKDANGNVVLRNAGISQESFQRSKCMTHIHQVELRKERMEQLQAEQQRRDEVNQQKLEAQVNALRVIEAKLLDRITDCEDASERELEYCSIEDFATLKSAELAAFIYAHDPAVSLKNQIPKLMGKLEEAKAALESGVPAVNNRIYTAYQCRCSPSQLERKLGLKQSDHVQESSPAEKVIVEVSVVLEDDLCLLPSAIMINDEWMERLKVLFSLDELFLVNIDGNLMRKADTLCEMLRRRMNRLLKRVNDATKRSITLGIQTRLEKSSCRGNVYGYCKSREGGFDMFG